MTTDVDKMLSDAIEHLRLVDDRDRVGDGRPQQFFPAPLSDVMLLAGALLVTRRELAEARERIAIMTPALTDARCDLVEARGDIVKLEIAFAETRRLVDALAGGVRVEGPATLEFRSLDGKHTRTVTVDVDPRPIKPASTEPRCCDECHSPMVALGHRRCSRCIERALMHETLREAGADRDKLRAALKRAIEGFEYWARLYADDRGTDVRDDAHAEIAELRRLL